MRHIVNAGEQFYAQTGRVINVPADAPEVKLWPYGAFNKASSNMLSSPTCESKRVCKQGRACLLKQLVTLGTGGDCTSPARLVSGKATLS